MNRFFVTNINNKKGLLTGEDYKHASKVLRLQYNDNIYVVNKKKEYIAKIIEDNGNNIIFEVIEETKSNREPDIDIYLYQSLPKKSKMDFIIQKNVEIGINQITPILSDRSLIKIKDKKKEIKKIERWKKIAKEASKQSMRNIIPKINNILNFDEMIKELKKLILNNKIEVIIPYENESNHSLKDLTLDKKDYHIIIGPEGGFAKEEINKIIEIGGKTVTLGPRILRSETAALVINSLLLYETNNMERD